MLGIKMRENMMANTQPYPQGPDHNHHLSLFGTPPDDLILQPVILRLILKMLIIGALQSSLRRNQHNQNESKHTCESHSHLIHS